LRASLQCFSGEGNGHVEVLDYSWLFVPSGELIRGVVQGHRPIWVSLWAKVECFSIEDNCFVEVLHIPEPIAPSGEINCKVVQRH